MGLCFVRLCIRISFQRKWRSTGRENITYHSSLSHEGKNRGPNCWSCLPCCMAEPVVHILGSGLQGAPGLPSWYCRVATCPPGPLNPSVRYRWSVGWITTYFWSYVLEFLSFQTMKSISCEPSCCFVIIWNEIQVALSKILPLNFDNAYILKIRYLLKVNYGIVC